MSSPIELTVNGAAHRVAITGERSLLSILRDDLGLTGCKIGCGEGACGTCTVLVDGQLTRACITPASTAAGHSVLTIEGLETDGQLHPLQQAFLDQDALQCGYCTPGMIMAALALLLQHPDPSEATIIEWMQGNICRCGTYLRIVRAIQQAATALRAQPGGHL